jgi:long-chain acyl-CoA synthetase
MIGGLLARTTALRPERPAARSKTDGAWGDLTYAEVTAIVEEIAKGLIAIGLEAGERICVLADTRAEWTFVDLAAIEAGLVVVPIYQTNSAEECDWVVTDSGATAILCEDEAQLAKVAPLLAGGSRLRTAILVDPPAGGAPPGTITLAELRERGVASPDDELRRRREAISPADPLTIIYTSGTTGPPKGCLLTHANYRASLDMVRGKMGLTGEEEDTMYLFLPLAHAAGLLMQLLALETGMTLAYWGRDRDRILPELAETGATIFPAVPRLVEKMYTRASAGVDAEELAELTAVGVEARELMIAGEGLPADLAERFAAGEERLFRRAREAFGGRLRMVISGAAPTSTAILETLFACGIPVMDTYGMTEVATSAAVSTLADHRFGSVGRPLPGLEVRIAGDGELLMRGANVFPGYYGAAAGHSIVSPDGWISTGDLARLDDDGYLYIVGRKKDIIITAGGKNIAPANLENELKRSRWISQAVMIGDARPYPVALVTLDEAEIAAWARDAGLPAALPELASRPEVRDLIAAEVDAVNVHYARVEQVKKFAILPRDLSHEAGELTTTMKVRRAAVAENHGDVIESLYEGS